MVGVREVFGLVIKHCGTCVLGPCMQLLYHPCRCGSC
jgi:hypothetical protein